MYDVISMKSIAQELNNRTYTDFFYRLMLLARSVFKWENLPNGMDEKWIERFLFNEGRCMFFHDNEKGYMVTKCVESGALNYYDEPVTVSPVATNYDENGRLLQNYEEAVVICNNDEMIPTSPTIQLFALRLAELTRTIDINVHAQKTPTLIVCNEKQRLTLQHIYKQWNGFEPVIYGDKNLDMDSIKVLKTDAPIVFDKLQYQKHATWNECMTFLGINNANQDKRERLVDDEVQANNEQVEQSADLMLKAREKAVERINKAFGLNIRVSKRSLDLSQIKAHFGIDEGNDPEDDAKADSQTS